MAFRNYAQGYFHILLPLQTLSCFNNGKIFFQWSKTALHKAAEEGHVDVVKYLVENGADVNATDKVRMMCAISQMRISVAIIISTQTQILLKIFRNALSLWPVNACKIFVLALL